MIKRIIGALYGIFLEEPLDRLHNWQKRFEKEYLNYCRTGCKNCYKWNGYCRSQASGTPYKKFRRKYHDMGKISHGRISRKARNLIWQHGRNG